MSNPLMQSMGNAGSPAAQKPDFIEQAMQAYKNGTINEFGEKQFRENPQFRQFVETVKGKNPFDLAKANGFDLSRFMNKL